MSEELLKDNKNENDTVKAVKKTSSSAPKKTAELKEKKVANPTKEVEVVTPQKTFTGDDLIWCKSTTYGGLSYVGVKTGKIYRFEAIGDCTEIEFQDLVGEVSKGTASNFIYEPLFMIIDEDVLKLKKPTDFTRVKDFYDTLSYAEDLEPIFEISSFIQFADALPRIPSGMSQSFLAMVGSKIETGELDSFKKIEAVDNFFGTDFKSLLK